MSVHLLGKSALLVYIENQLAGVAIKEPAIADEFIRRIRILGGSVGSCEKIHIEDWGDVICIKNPNYIPQRRPMGSITVDDKPNERIEQKWLRGVQSSISSAPEVNPDVNEDPEEFLV